MELLLNTLSKLIEKVIEDPSVPWTKKQFLKEAQNEIRQALTGLRDLERPRPPIHERVCRIMILLAQGGLFDR